MRSERRRQELQGYSSPTVGSHTAPLPLHFIGYIGRAWIPRGSGLDEGVNLARRDLLGEECLRDQLSQVEREILMLRRFGSLDSFLHSP